MRSMINYMQSNQHYNIQDNIISDATWENLLQITSENIDQAVDEAKNVSTKYNMEKKHVVKNMMNFIVRNKPELLNDIFLTTCKNITHNQEGNTNYLMNYFFSRLNCSLQL